MPVGYQAKTTNTERVTLVSDPGYWVDILTELDRGGLKQAEAKLVKANVQPDGEGGTSASIDPDVAEYRNLMVLYSIVDWNLDDHMGNKLKITPENVDLLKGRDFDKIYERVNALNGDMSEADQRRFPDQGERRDPDGNGVGTGESQPVPAGV